MSSLAVSGLAPKAGSALQTDAGVPERQLALVVDDDQVIRLLGARALEKAGLEVVLAGSGDEALEIVKRQAPDLVLLDVQMPGMDGFATCRALRSNPQLQYLPILMMTGLDDAESVERAYEAGATDFVGKPVPWLLLGHRARYLLRSAAAFRQLSESRAKLARSESLLVAAQRIARIATWRWDSATGALTWSEPQEQLLGEHVQLPLTLNEYFDLVHPDDLPLVKSHFRKSIQAITGDRLEHRFIDTMGQVRLIELQFEPTGCGPAGVLSGIHGTARDMTERWRAEQRIHQLAFYDSLTGLPNRQLFLQQVTRAIEQASQSAGQFALLFVDLDYFKDVNDTHGHGVGDALLRTVAERLRGAMRGRGGGARARDSIARIGGDEFVALVTDVPHEGAAMDLARRLLETLRAPLVVEGHAIRVSGSIGVALYPQDADDYDGLLRKADAAMYRAKVEGRGTARLHADGAGHGAEHEAEHGDAAFTTTSP